MKWSKIPGFLWPLVIKYFGSRIVRMRVPVLVSGRVYFLLLALPLGITISKKDNLYQVCSYGNAPSGKTKKILQPCYVS